MKLQQWTCFRSREIIEVNTKRVKTFKKFAVQMYISEIDQEHLIVTFKDLRVIYIGVFNKDVISKMVVCLMDNKKNCTRTRTYKW